MKPQGARKIIRNTENMGDTLYNKFTKTQDLKVAQTALSAYRVALAIAKGELQHKKLTGEPAKIDFFKK